MKYFKLLILSLLSFLFIACEQDSNKQAAPLSVFEEKEKTPLEELVTKVQNTVIIEPLRPFEGNPYFYNIKQTLSRSLENSTQKEVFFSCNDFKRTLKITLQTEYSSDFVAGSWQRTEVEKLAQDLAKEQCGDIHNLRALLLTDLQRLVNASDSQEEFIKGAKPAIESYASKVLEKSNYYLGILSKILVPYKKVRQAFYPLEQAGYGTYILEQNDFNVAKELATPIIQGKDEAISEEKLTELVNRAEEEEKILFVFLKQFDSLVQTQKDCIRNFFPGLKNKWYDFMYEIEKLPADKRQEYADKRFKQAKEGLQNKCPDLYKDSKKPKSNVPQISQNEAKPSRSVNNTPQQAPVNITNNTNSEDNDIEDNEAINTNEESEAEYYF